MTAEIYGILTRRMEPEIGFRELAHTADWELEVWAPDLMSLLEQAARGMYAMSGVKLEESPRKSRALNLEAPDPESLLVKFLADLLWAEENEQLGFDQFNIIIKNPGSYTLSADLSGARITHVDKEIKAVTYHNLSVQTTPRGLRVVIVFDV